MNGFRRLAVTTAALATMAAGTVAASSAPASAASTPRCNSATSYAGQTMPGYNGKRVPCYLAKGSKGATVKVLQRYLNKATSHHLTVDGSYGPATQSAVRAYQSAWNGYPCADSAQIRAIHLAVDGSWGPLTSKTAQNKKEWCGD